MIRIGALISGSGTNLAAVIRACQTKKIDGEVVFVGTDNPAAGGLEKARVQNIPTFVVDYKTIIRSYRKSPATFALPPDFPEEETVAKMALFSSDIPENRKKAFLRTRVAAEHRLLKAMAAYPFDLLILAGFMRNLTPYFIDRVNTNPAIPRIMNIHPALLPAFPGVDGYGDTWRYGCKVGGCTVHFIDYGEDSGPIIGQKAFAIRPEDTLDSIKAKGLQREWELYPECIQLFAEGRLELQQRSRKPSAGQTATRTVVIIKP